MLYFNLKSCLNTPTRVCYLNFYVCLIKSKHNRISFLFQQFTPRFPSLFTFHTLSAFFANLEIMRNISAFACSSASHTILLPLDICHHLHASPSFCSGRQDRETDTHNGHFLHFPLSILPLLLSALSHHPPFLSPPLVYILHYKQKQTPVKTFFFLTGVCFIYLRHTSFIFV